MRQWTRTDYRTRMNNQNRVQKPRAMASKTSSKTRNRRRKRRRRKRCHEDSVVGDSESGDDLKESGNPGQTHGDAEPEDGEDNADTAFESDSSISHAESKRGIDFVAEVRQLANKLSVPVYISVTTGSRRYRRVKRIPVDPHACILITTGNKETGPAIG